MAKRDFWRTSAALCALTYALAAGPGAARADVEDGIAAYEAGNYEDAMAQWRPLAEAGDAVAQYWLGRLFERGEGVPASLARAAMWYRLAASQNHAEAQAALDNVLETLRARETGEGGPQVAEGPGGQTAAPGYEPDRDPAYSAPGQTPSRTADVDQPAGVPARDGLPPPQPDVAVRDADATDPAVADAGAPPDAARDGTAVADVTVATEENGTAATSDGMPGADGEVPGADTVDGREPAAIGAEAAGPVLAESDVVEGDVAEDPAALAADALEAQVLDDAVADAVDPVAEEPVADGGAVADGIGDLAALDQDALLNEVAPEDVPVEPGIAADVVEEAGIPFEAPLPPELSEALADGTLDAEEIAELVEDGVLTEELVDRLVEAGILDETALAELAGAGVLDEAALDALVEQGLVDEAMVDVARDVLADGTVAADDVTVVRTEDAPAAEPARRLITARR